MEQYQIAFEQFKKLEDKDETANVMTGVGLTYKEWAKFSKALDAFTKSQQIYLEIDNKENVANLSDWIGDTYQEWGKYSEALKNYQFALDYFAESDAKDQQVSVMYDISKTYSNWGRYPESLKMIQSAQEILEKEGEETHTPVYLMGLRYQDWGKYPEALEAYKKAHAILEKTNENEIALAEIHFSIGKTLYEYGKFDDALSSLEQSLSICEHLGLTNRSIYRLRRIGETLAMLERYSEAKDKISRGVLMAQNLHNDFSEALCYSSMVTMSKVTKNVNEGRKYFSLAKSMLMNCDSQLEIAELLQNMGFVEENFGNVNNALGLYEETVLIYRNFNRLHELAKALRNLGRTQKKVGADNSIATLEESANLFISVHRGDEAEITRRLI